MTPKHPCPFLQTYNGKCDCIHNGGCCMISEEGRKHFEECKYYKKHIRMRRTNDIRRGGNSIKKER
jgi:hypothetical protein